MAVQKTPGNTILRLVLETGVDQSGKPILRNKSFDAIKAEASDQDIYEVGQALGNLQKHPLNKVLRVDQGELINE